jgi:hypothetical protein
MQVKAGRFILNTVTGAQAVTGVGFQPNLILFGSAFATSVPWTSANILQSFGAAADDATQGCFAFSAPSGANPTASSRCTYADRALIYLNNLDASINTSAAVSSMDADGFTLDVQVFNAASALYVNYIAIGGLTDVTVAQLATKTVSGNFAYTGIGFQPDAAIFLHGLPTTLPQGAANIFGGIGFCDTDLNQGGYALWDQDNVSSTVVYTDISATYPVLAVQTAVLVGATVVSFDVDGLTLR